MASPLTPEALVQLMQLMGDQKNQQINEALRPRGRIAESPKNGTRSHGLAGWYELNPQARPGESYNQEQARIRREQQVPAGKLPGPSQPQQNNTGNAPAGSFMTWLGSLFGGQQQQGPRVNPQTGLPFGTLPGDPAYQDMLVKGAPRANVVMDLNAERALQSDPAFADMESLLSRIQAPNGALDSLRQGQEMLRQRNSPSYPNSPAIGIQAPQLNSTAGLFNFVQAGRPKRTVKTNVTTPKEPQGPIGGYTPFEKLMMGIGSGVTSAAKSAVGYEKVRRNP